MSAGYRYFCGLCKNPRTFLGMICVPNEFIHSPGNGPRRVASSRSAPSSSRAKPVIVLDVASS